MPTYRYPHNGTVCAGLVWQKTPDGWRVVDAAPILRPLIGADADRVRAYLTGKGASWDWV